MSEEEQTEVVRGCWTSRGTSVKEAAGVGEDVMIYSVGTGEETTDTHPRTEIISITMAQSWHAWGGKDVGVVEPQRAVAEVWGV